MLSTQQLYDSQFRRSQSKKRSSRSDVLPPVSATDVHWRPGRQRSLQRVRKSVQIFPKWAKRSRGSKRRRLLGLRCERKQNNTPGVISLNPHPNGPNRLGELTSLSAMSRKQRELFTKQSEASFLKERRRFQVQKLHASPTSRSLLEIRLAFLSSSGWTQANRVGKRLAPRLTRRSAPSTCPLVCKCQP